MDGNDKDKPIQKGWKKVKLGEVAEIKNGKSNSQDASEKGIYPFFDRSKQIKKSSRFIFDTTAIIVPGEGKEFIPRFYKGKFDLHQRAYAIFGFNSNGNPKYIYYYILFSNKYFESIAVGSTVMSLRLNHFTEFPILLPPLEEQKAIASVLSSLDDKIDLLHRQNQTLEAMAETLFRKWFVENAKEDWEEVKLGDIIEISSGKGLRKNEFVENGLYPVLGANGEIGKTNNFLFNERLIFTGRVGTLGNIFISEGKVWLSDNTLIIKPIAQEYFYFVYFFLKMAKLEELNVGSTQPLIRQTDLKELDIIIPNKEKIYCFHRNAEQFFNKIRHNQHQIRTLEQMRDTLLPKLMRGEIRIMNNE